MQDLEENYEQNSVKMSYDRGMNLDQSIINITHINFRCYNRCKIHSRAKINGPDVSFKYSLLKFEKKLLISFLSRILLGILDPKNSSNANNIQTINVHFHANKKSLHEKFSIKITPKIVTTTATYIIRLLTHILLIDSLSAKLVRSVLN